MALHTMAILQAYQADVLKKMDEEEMDEETPPFPKLGYSGRRLAMISVDKFCSAKSQSAALKQFMPRWMRDSSNTPSNSLPREPSSRSCAPALYGLGSPRPAFSPPTTPQTGGPIAARQAFLFSSSKSSLTLRSGRGERPQKPQKAGPDRSNISACLQHAFLTQVCPPQGFGLQKESINNSLFGVAFGRRTRLSPPSVQETLPVLFYSVQAPRRPLFSPVLRSPSS